MAEMQPAIRLGANRVTNPLPVRRYRVLLPSFAFLLHNCVMQAYKSKADLQSAVEWLAARDDRLAHAYDKHGCPLAQAR